MKTIEIPISQIKRITSKPFDHYSYSDQKRLASILFRVNGQPWQAQEIESNAVQFNFAILDDTSVLTTTRA